MTTLQPGSWCDEGVLEAAHLVAGAFASGGGGAARGPVVHDEVELFAKNGAAHHEEAAGRVGGVAAHKVGVRHHLLVFIDIKTEVYVGLVFIEVVEGYEEGLFEFEKAGIVEERAVYAAAVGAFVVHILYAALGEHGLCAKVFEHVLVLDFGNANHGGSALQAVGAQFAEHTGHVFHLAGVLHGAPVLHAAGQVFVVVLAFVVKGVEQIFKVVEAHADEGKLLFAALGEGARSEREDCKEADDNFFHSTGFD